MISLITLLNEIKPIRNNKWPFSQPMYLNTILMSDFYKNYKITREDNKKINQYIQDMDGGELPTFNFVGLTMNVASEQAASPNSNRAKISLIRAIWPEAKIKGDIFNEVKPIDVPKTWNFRRYIPGFNPKSIKVGDYIIIVNEGNDFKKYKISFIDYGMGGENSKYFIFYFADMKIHNHISNQALIHINNQNKPKSDKQEVKPEYIKYIKTLLQQKSNSYISKIIDSIERNGNQASKNQLRTIQVFRNGG